MAAKYSPIPSYLQIPSCQSVVSEYWNRSTEQSSSKTDLDVIPQCSTSGGKKKKKKRGREEKNHFSILSEKVSKRNIKLWQRSSRWQAHQTQWQIKILKYGSKMTHTPVLQSEVNNKPAQFILQNLARVTWQQQLLSKPIPGIGKLQGLVNTPENARSGDVKRKKKLLIDDNFNICSVTTLYHPMLVCRKMISFQGDCDKILQQTCKSSCTQKLLVNPVPLKYQSPVLTDICESEGHIDWDSQKLWCFVQIITKYP